MTSASGSLVPAGFETLLAWALDGLARERAVFGLPRRSFRIDLPDPDLSVEVAGGRAATPLGVAAGPHTQLAQNLVTGWLAGARVLELKTVQALDRLEIPRPCIDAPAEGYNVEWSQELRLGESLEQYVAAWHLLHAIAPRALGSEAAARALAGTRFDTSVGYDLAGIRSEPVARFLDGLADASLILGRQRDSLAPALREAVPPDVPTRVVGAVTLSSFHGCPPDEIERIVEHLFSRHGLDVVVKLNPTLLGFDDVDALLHGPLGWDDVRLDRGAFERDLGWDAALAMLERLRRTAQRRGLALGVKLTNTLVVRNTRGRLAGNAVYLSGPPLHPIAIGLAARLATATGGTIPLSLSGGVDAENFADAVACGFAPVTTCTDLLRPTGYRRLPRYLKALEEAMERDRVRDLDSLAMARARARGEAPQDPRAAALANLGAYAAEVAGDARYGAESARAASAAAPRTPLTLVDCESCNRCTLACPNGAFFDVSSPPAFVSWDLWSRVGRVEREKRAIAPERERQWALLADFCNECGNCDTFCPQAGGPHRAKPRFHTSHAAWEQDTAACAVLVADGGRRIEARIDGSTVTLEPASEGWRLSSGSIVGVLDADGRPLECAAANGTEDTRVPLATLWWLRLLTNRALESVNPLSARIRIP